MTPRAPAWLAPRLWRALHGLAYSRKVGAPFDPPGPRPGSPPACGDPSLAGGRGGWVRRGGWAGTTKLRTTKSWGCGELQTGQPVGGSRGNIEWLGRRPFAQRSPNPKETRTKPQGPEPPKDESTDMMISPKPRIRKIIQNLRNLTHKLNLAESSKTCETLPKTLAIHTRTRNSCPYPHGSRN